MAWHETCNKHQLETMIAYLTDKSFVSLSFNEFKKYKYVLGIGSGSN